MAYILGRRAFRRVELEVGPGVLVPRPETELLVEWALELTGAGDRVLDWGTGSGAIALALADEGDSLRVSGVEVSGAALEYASTNAERLGLEVELLRSDGTAAVDGRSFDLVVANPPYVRSGDLASLGPELGFEPADALVAGETGLEVHARVVADAASALVAGGWLLLEIGSEQAADVVELLGDAGFVDIAVRRDLAGHDRAVGARTGSDGPAA